MADPSGPLSSPSPTAATSDPRSDIVRREIQQFIATTLSEIQYEQGKQSERTDAQIKAIEALTTEVRRLSDASLLSDRSIQDFGPKIATHHRLYERTMGAAWILSASAIVIGGLLYWTNATRLDRLLKVLDSPGIEAIIRKDRPR